MFLDMLSQKQQELFIDAMHHLLSADGVVHDEEQLLLQRFAVETGHLSEPAPVSLEDLVGRATAQLAGEPVVGRAFLAELAGVAVIDGAVHGRELDILRSVADAAGIPSDHMDDFLGFAERARDLIREGNRLISTSNARA